MTAVMPAIEHALRTMFRLRREGGSTALPDWLLEHKLHFLREVDILRDLTPEEMDWLKHTTRMVTYEAGRMIYGPQQKAETLLILKWGRVRVYRLTPEGKKLEIANLGAGTFFGQMPFLHQRMHNTFAEAVEDSLICIMSRQDVERLIERKPQVAIRMLEVLSDRLAASESRLEALAFQGVTRRLAGALLQLAENGVVHASHQELADAVGAYRETVTKTLDEFQREGLVELSRMRIGLKDSDRLATLAGRETEATTHP